MNKYFLYARKSTDEEDRQMLSIESQINELREFAKKENLEIAEEFTEAKTAKEPGRPVFSYVLKQIEGGLASGILAKQLLKIGLPAFAVRPQRWTSLSNSSSE